ncbi:hypothetical protein [Streptomyces sp. NPDC006134]|uniref:hypothetical protein n=1 Tax=Streptomyces sp. NPDC006134 TaxID=3154467 RepID=UPI0033FB7DB4
MGWGDMRRRLRDAGPAWSYDETYTAAAVCAGQLPAAGLIWWVVSSTGDDYGVGYGGAFGLACLVLFAPLYLPFLGLLHTVLHIAPAALLARAAGRRVPGPEWVRHLTGAALVASAWAALADAVGAGGFAATAVGLTALGVLPVLALAYVRRRGRAPGRAWGCWGVWFRAGGAAVALFAVAFGGLLAADRMGLIDAYEPPVLSAAQLAGTWRGEDGAVLRLDPGGRAGLSRLPERSGSSEAWADGTFAVCDGTGTWSLDREGRADPYPEDGPGERDGVVVRPGGGCGEDTYWTIGGTERRPELFVLFGDPDAGELHILTRD